MSLQEKILQSGDILNVIYCRKHHIMIEAFITSKLVGNMGAAGLEHIQCYFTVLNVNSLVLDITKLFLTLMQR